MDLDSFNNLKKFTYKLKLYYENGKTTGFIIEGEWYVMQSEIQEHIDEDVGLLKLTCEVLNDKQLRQIRDQNDVSST